MDKKALVLLSGGIDSTTCLALAEMYHSTVEAISVNYGQRHLKELECAQKICERLDVPWHPIELQFPNTMLTDSNQEIPDISYDDIEGVSPTYVPFRNGLMLSQLASIAQAKGFDYIYYGAHAEDAANWAYPDCTPEFNGAMANAIYVGTYHAVRLMTPLQWLNKEEVVKLGIDVGAPLELTWSCYKGEGLHCGVCPTCRSRKQAFLDAGITDVTTYGG